MSAICILTQSDYEVDPRVRRKAEALAAANYSVDVLALRPPHGRPFRTLNGVNVYTIPLRKRRGTLARYLYEYAAFFLWAFVRTTLLMRRRRYALIDVNTLPDFLIFAPIVAKWMGARLVLDMHEITPEFCVSKYGVSEKSWMVRLMARVERASFRFANHVITINEPIQNLLARRGLPPSRSTVIMNAADETRFMSGSRPCVPERARSDRTFVMVYHGTLTRIYGLDIAVEAFRLAQADMPDAELWILGTGPEAQPLANLAQRYGLESRVKLLGLVSSSEIPAWLEKCDVGILPIRRDVFLDFAFPNKLPEYIVTGKAVVISRLKAIQHYFSPEAVAYFEPGDPADLAKQMVRLYRDPGVRARLAARAKEEYAPTRWDVMKDRYLTLVERMIGPARESVGGLPASESSLPQVVTPHLPAYVLITPARNEAQFLGLTVRSVVKQTARPLKWVIVSDGSTDGTDDIARASAAEHDWIEFVRLPERTSRSFAGKVAAFNAGCARVAGLPYEVIGNLDADVSFEPDYLAFLLAKFAENPALGVAGTPYREEHAIHDDSFKSPEHVSGACQMFRRTCFEAIGGYPPVESGGVDLIALLAAQAKGWRTRRFDEMVCLHHRNVGSGQHAGLCRRLLNRGRKDYLLGSHPAFEIFRSAHQMKNRPYVAGGALMLVGYFWALTRGVERSMPAELIEIRRKDQLQRLKQAFRHPLRRDERRIPAV